MPKAVDRHFAYLTILLYFFLVTLRLLSFLQFAYLSTSAFSTIRILRMPATLLLALAPLPLPSILPTALCLPLDFLTPCLPSPFHGRLGGWAPGSITYSYRVCLTGRRIYHHLSPLPFLNTYCSLPSQFLGWLGGTLVTII